MPVTDCRTQIFAAENPKCCLREGKLRFLLMAVLAGTTEASIVG